MNCFTSSTSQVLWRNVARYTAENNGVSHFTLLFADFRFTRAQTFESDAVIKSFVFPCHVFFGIGLFKLIGIIYHFRITDKCIESVRERMHLTHDCFQNYKGIF